MTYRSPENRERNEFCVHVIVLCILGLAILGLFAYLTGEVFGWWPR